MKLTFLSACLLGLGVHGFTVSVPNTRLTTSKVSDCRTGSPLFSTSMGKEGTSSSSSSEDAVPATEDLDQAAAWELQLQTKEVEEVRQELIQKYISLGRTLEYAEKEVDQFLSDPERSQQFLDMRRYAKAQANDLGFESLFQIGGAFMLGLGFTVGANYYSAYKVR